MHLKVEGADPVTRAYTKAPSCTRHKQKERHIKSAINFACGRKAGMKKCSSKWKGKERQQKISPSKERAIFHNYGRAMLYCLIYKSVTAPVSDTWRNPLLVSIELSMYMLSCIKIKVASMFVSCTWIRMGTHSSQP
jgi:hypothetical protein